MKNILFIILILFVNIFAQSNIDWAKVHNLTVSGIEKLYSLKTQNAISDFNEVIKIAPNDPRGYFFKAIAYYYRYFLLYDEDAYNSFMKESDKVIDVCQNHLKNYEDSKLYFYLGGIKGYRGIIQAIYAKGLPPLSVLKEGREAYSHLQKALELNKENYDAYMGLGLFTYIIGSLPKAARWIVSVLGFKGDKQLGLKYLELAYQKGLYTNYEAMWWLTFIYMGQNNDEQASKHLEIVLKKFPQNNLFLILNGSFHLGLGNVDKAFENFQRAEITYTEDAKSLTKLSSSGIAFCYYYKGDYQKALEKFQFFFDNVTEKEDRWRNRDNSFYFAGLTCEILGDVNKAKQYYSKNKYNEFAKLRMETPLTANQIEILKSYNIAYAQNYNEGVTKLNDILKNKLNQDERAFAYYYLGEIYRIKKDYKNAILFYNKTFETNPQNENWIKPYSHYNLGIIYKIQKDFELAKSEFKNVDNYKNFYNKKRLEFLVRNAEADLYD